MTSRVVAILEEFEQLSDTEQWDVAKQILRRTTQWDNPPLTDAELIMLVEEQFLDLDSEEGSSE